MNEEQPDQSDRLINAIENTDFSDESTIRQALRRDLLTREVRRASVRPQALNAFALGIMALSVIGFVVLVLVLGRGSRAVAPASQATATPEGWWHIVQEGEDLKCIVQQFGYSDPEFIDKTVALNGLDSAEDIEVGQTLLIPTPEPFVSDVFSAAEASTQVGWQVLSPSYLPANLKLNSFVISRMGGTRVYTGYIHWGSGHGDGGYLIVAQLSPAEPLDQLVPRLPDNQTMTDLRDVSVRGQQGKYIEYSDPPRYGCLRQHEYHNLVWTEGDFSFEVLSGQYSVDELMQVAASLTYDPNAPTLEAPEVVAETTTAAPTASDVPPPTPAVTLTPDSTLTPMPTAGAAVLARTIGDPFTPLFAAPYSQNDRTLIVSAEVPPGTELPVIGEWVGYDWYMVRWENGTAWVSAYLLTIVGDAAQIPSVNPPASMLPTPTAGILFLYNEADIAQIEQMAGFDVLLPTFMPDRYKFEKYDVNTGDGRTSVNIYYAYRTETDPLGEDVLYLHQSKSETDTLEEIASTFGEEGGDHVREQIVTEITVNGVNGYYVIVVADESQNYLEQRAVIWSKDGFIFGVHTMRATFEELIQIAESLE